jgi:hypothetical protein
MPETLEIVFESGTDFRAKKREVSRFVDKTIEDFVVKGKLPFRVEVSIYPAKTGKPKPTDLTTEGGHFGH